MALPRPGMLSMPWRREGGERAAGMNNADLIVQTLKGLVKPTVAVGFTDWNAWMGAEIDVDALRPREDAEVE